MFPRHPVGSDRRTSQIWTDCRNLWAIRPCSCSLGRWSKRLRPWAPPLAGRAAAQLSPPHSAKWAVAAEGPLELAVPLVFGSGATNGESSEPKHKPRWHCYRPLPKAPTHAQKALRPSQLSQSRLYISCPILDGSSCCPEFSYYVSGRADKAQHVSRYSQVEHEMQKKAADRGRGRGLGKRAKAQWYGTLFVVFCHINRFFWVSSHISRQRA